MDSSPKLTHEAAGENRRLLLTEDMLLRLQGTQVSTHTFLTEPESYVLVSYMYPLQKTIHLPYSFFDFCSLMTEAGVA